jgi:2-polyprenyl-3-methyl-5-hydroxy-6-metoxy-1,4-benzoquinol methylase
VHASARNFVAGVVGGRVFDRVVEVGGRDINGGVRDLVTCAEYLSIDLAAGPAVDVVADCRDWSPPWLADLVICCEVLEHSPDPGGVVAACLGYLRPDGLLVLTCAGPGRKPHSGHDGAKLRPGEHYGNIDPDVIRRVLSGVDDVHVEYHPGVCDVYATGRRR